MAYYLAYCHLDQILVKKGDVLTGQHNVGIIGNSGSTPQRPMAKHLHAQLETALPSGYSAIRGFDQFADPSNIKVVTDKYGIICHNDVTQSFYNYNPQINSTAICGGHHSGTDFSGNIDKPYESKYCFTPAKAKCTVIATGFDPYNPPHWGGYGNYVIVKVEEAPMAKTLYNFGSIEPRYKITITSKGKHYHRIKQFLLKRNTHLYSDVACTKEVSNLNYSSTSPVILDVVQDMGTHSKKRVFKVVTNYGEYYCIYKVLP